jgi:hypothetical protein
LSQSRNNIAETTAMPVFATVDRRSCQQIQIIFIS